MEVIDPFVPSFESTSNGFGDVPEDWASPYGDAASPTEPAAGSFPALGDEVPGATVSQDEVNGSTAVQDPPADAGLEETATAGPVDESASSTKLLASDSIARAQSMAQQLDATLRELQSTLDSSATEQSSLLSERAQLQDQIHALEEEAAKKERFKSMMLSGSGASLSNDDLAALQSMTDALTQDPDRLTLLFNVVQQAPKLATAVNVFTQLRRMAEEF